MYFSKLNLYLLGIYLVYSILLNIFIKEKLSTNLKFFRTINFLSNLFYFNYSVLLYCSYFHFNFFISSKTILSFVFLLVFLISNLFLVFNTKYNSIFSGFLICFLFFFGALLNSYSWLSIIFFFEIISYLMLIFFF